MANRRIRLTYLWSDGSILLEDFSRKASEKMTTWANAFYGRYGFELDIVPTPFERSSAGRASKFILSRDRGVTPDLRDDSEIVEKDTAEIAVIDEQISAAEREQGKAKLLVDRLKYRSEQLEKVRDNLEIRLSAATDPVLRQQLEAQLTANKSQLDPIRAAYEQAWKGYMAWYDVTGPLHDKTIAIYGRMRIKGMQASGEYELRHQMALRYKRDRVGEGDRVNIVFCRMAGWLGMRQSSWITTGYTFSQLEGPIMSIPDLTLLWPYPFIVIDLASTARSVAHELVHAAGQLHPGPMKVYTDLEKRLVRMRLPKGSLGGLPFTNLDLSYREPDFPFQIIPGALFDGPADDLMNYTLADDLGPEACNLNASDKQLLEKANFVKS